LGKKIEDLTPRKGETVLQASKSAIQILDSPTHNEADRIPHAKHKIRDATHILGYTDDLVNENKVDLV
jgi:hypothetical protein